MIHFRFLRVTFVSFSKRLILGIFALGIMNASQAHAKAISLVQQGSYAISSSLLQNILAKEICSCVFVSKVGGEALSPQARAEKCILRSQLPLSPGLLSLLLDEKIDPRATSLEVTPKLLGALLGLFQGHGALARFEGEKVGCRLLTDVERRSAGVSAHGF